MDQQTRFEKFRERYRTGETPWDGELPPPEVMDLAANLTPGRALDLGCGYGRTCIYLAQQGWQVDAVDFVPEAIEGARQRAQLQNVADRVRFFVGSVHDMPFLQDPYALIIDVGCMHGLPPEQLIGYRDELARLLASGGRYLLFAHLQSETDEPGRWIEETAVTALFADAFTLTREEHGTTQVADNPPWRSAWYWFQKR